MSKFKKQYKIMTNSNREKLELKVYFEINHEGWVPLGGAIFIEEDCGPYWAQTLWLPEAYWPEEKKADMEPSPGLKDDNCNAIKELTG